MYLQLVKFCNCEVRKFPFHEFPHHVSRLKTYTWKPIIIQVHIDTKTAITLAPPTVGRQSADLSADKMPDFSSFFIGRQKINYNLLVIIFFPSADSFGVLAIGR